MSKLLVDEISDADNTGPVTVTDGAVVNRTGDDTIIDLCPNEMPLVQISDASLDLGAAGVRFKNLYLSGGVYLGGTGSANYLDDYEEGDGQSN
jgi:hypothetical protein